MPTTLTKQEKSNSAIIENFQGFELGIELLHLAVANIPGVAQFHDIEIDDRETLKNLLKLVRKEDCTLRQARVSLDLLLESGLVSTGNGVLSITPRGARIAMLND